ncbi:hypothetical protein [Aliamphritea hakodatensis]|uniref:hypothetical protein n=1 Tax=Aliamphritea hakodatensis TaxID=2895352 RepID=UPI0022FD4CEF|nr:hypothetical protein [Aliamphritea hakodatensis]
MNSVSIQSDIERVEMRNSYFSHGNGEPFWVCVLAEKGESVGNTVVFTAATSDEIAEWFESMAAEVRESAKGQEVSGS